MEKNIVKGRIFVFSGVSGAGKSVITQHLLSKYSHCFSLSISVTTRQPRIGEEEGKHYYFLSEEAFLEKRRKGEFLEWAHVYGNYYGTIAAHVQEILSKGWNILFDIDWQGYQQVLQSLPQDTVGIFILPPSLEDLKARLLKRGKDSLEEIEFRMKKACSEIAHAVSYPYSITNDTLDCTLKKIESILESEKYRVDRYKDYGDYLKKKFNC